VGEGRSVGSARLGSGSSEDMVFFGFWSFALVSRVEFLVFRGDVPRSRIV